MIKIIRNVVKGKFYFFYSAGVMKKIKNNLLKMVWLFVAVVVFTPGVVGADHYNGNDPINWDEVIANANGNTYIVSTKADFIQKVALAQPGDMILIPGGTYGWNSHIRGMRHNMYYSSVQDNAPKHIY